MVGKCSTGVYVTLVTKPNNSVSSNLEDCYVVFGLKFVQALMTCRNY